MKTIIALSVIILGLFACNKGDNTCNESLYNFVDEHVQLYENISRDSLARMGWDTQFIILNSLSPINKARIFHEKINLLLSSDSVSEADKNHLASLNNHLSEFTCNTNKTDTFYSKWQQEAFNKLGWDSLKMYTYAETWLTYTAYLNFQNSLPFLPANGLNCKCNSRFACNFGFTGCIIGGCSRSTSGCGLVGDSPCKGVCNY